jgi:hypothetical protein
VTCLLTPISAQTFLLCTPIFQSYLNILHHMNGGSSVKGL